MDLNKTLSIIKRNNNMKKEEIQKTLDFVKSLNNAINLLEDGDTIDNVFSSGELETLQDLYFSEIEVLVGNENAQYLWNLLTQNRTEEISDYLPSLAYVKEFCYYGDDLSPDHGARQILMAKGITKVNGQVI
jgi:hypothetical protein